MQKIIVAYGFFFIYFSGNNERIGEYQYLGDDGKLYTVRYSAGVNGFRILNGDHIPSGKEHLIKYLDEVIIF